MKRLRRYTAHLLFAFSSLCKAAGKFIMHKEKTIVVDVLSLPGWYILDDHIIHHVPLDTNCGLTNGFGWESWPMPSPWCEYRGKLKQVQKNRPQENQGRKI